MNIICFLTVRPSKLFYDFCKQLKGPKYDIYICIDDNSYSIFNCDNDITIIKINNQDCENAGFKNTVTYCKNKACSRDKALYYFCNNNIDFNYIWFIEEDVFIPNTDTILNIDNKYINSDLLCQSNTILYDKANSDNWYHWKRVFNECELELPYCNSMVCAIRCSKKLLNIIQNYAVKYKTLFFCEVIFNTLAFQNNLEIIIPDELQTIVFRRNWKIDEIKKTHLYHPIKDIALQYKYRAK